ncbi:hypothetical protein BV20DRAFT_1014123 [Pilatotrama ljubarskyi]|nr:hypothetical protein BV20DRAFT_1014123 [Pilatotrama ljubarskyi]
MHERSISSLAAKGKAKESVHWHLGWWDFSHSLEGTRRPIQWSKSSVIFTAHESQPLVLARHFPTSRQFALPSPNPIISALGAYDPPSVLSISPTDDWFFAYFPGKGVDGLGCLWRKASQLDSWAVWETWSIAVGSGVVTAAWTSAHREWTVSDAGTSSRLPTMGPITPVGSPLLLLVTQNHQLQLCTLPPSTASLKITRATLLQPTDPAHQPADSEPLGRIGGDRICTQAAIGLCYQDHTVLVAMRSRLMPSQNSSQAPQNPLDISLSLDMAQPPPPESPFLAEWELWGEELVVSLCEVRLEWRHAVPPVTSRPLPPIYHPSSQLVDLVFFCPPVPHPQASAASDTKPKPEASSNDASRLYLAATFLDTGDYTSLPTSEIVCYAFAARDPPPGPGDTHWVLKEERKRTSPTKVPCFLLPSIGRAGILAGFMDARGLLPRRKQNSKETTAGAIEVLKLPDLTASEDWDSVPIRSHVDHGNVDVPVSVALSPNETLISCVSSHLLGSHMSVQVLPRRVSGGLASITASHLHGDLARQLVRAIRARYSPSDIVHALATPSLPLEVTVNTLHNAYAMMEADSNGLVEIWTAELLGVATEVYRCSPIGTLRSPRNTYRSYRPCSSRAQRLDRGTEKDLCAARWQTAHDITSLKACCGAFDACQEGDAYDLDAVWQLVGLSGWIVELVERMFKECVLVGDNPVAGPSTPKDRDLPDSLSLDSPIFLHLVHPYPLSRLQTAIEHVKRFRDHVAKLTAKGENSHIAKDVLMDITDCSGLDLQSLGPLLTEILQDCKQSDAQELRRSLASCCPTPSLKPHVRKAIDKILSSKAIDRARLFIKPSDLVDGVNRLSVSEPGPRTNKGKDIDVVNKGLLLPRRPGIVCLRCGGRSEVAMESVAGTETSIRWQTWHRTWRWRCVCGGQWAHVAGESAVI